MGGGIAFAALAALAAQSGTAPADPYKEQAPVLERRKLTTLTGKLGDISYGVRSSTHRTIAGNRVCDEGLVILIEALKKENAKKTPNMEAVRRLEKLCDLHREPRIPPLVEKYKRIRPRNSSSGDAWLWNGSLGADQFVAPGYFYKIHGLNHAEITGLYLSNVTMAALGDDWECENEYPNYYRATRLFVRDWVDAAVRQHFGKPDFDELMQRETDGIRHRLEQMVLGDEVWRKAHKHKSRFIPINLHNEHIKKVPVVKD